MNGISLRVIAYVFGALALAIFGFIAYNVIFIVNAVVMAIALYVASFIVVGVELKKLLNVSIISFFLLSCLVYASLSFNSSLPSVSPSSFCWF